MAKLKILTWYYAKIAFFYKWRVTETELVESQLKLVKINCHAGRRKNLSTYCRFLLVAIGLFISKKTVETAISARCEKSLGTIF